MQTYCCHNTVRNVIIFDRWISVDKSIMTRTVEAWELEHIGLKESHSIGLGRVKQTLLSGSVILHMTQYYPNKSHILIKTGIPLQTARGPSLDRMWCWRECILQMYCHNCLRVHVVPPSVCPRTHTTSNLIKCAFISDKGMTEVCGFGFNSIPH